MQMEKSKFVVVVIVANEVVSVVNVDDENRVGDSLWQSWELKFGHKAKLLLRL